MAAKDAKKPAPKAAAGGEKKGGQFNHVRYKSYSIAGDKLERKNRSCPKCGPGIFMANHKDRSSCGKCSYTEMKSKQ